MGRGIALYRNRVRAAVTKKYFRMTLLGASMLAGPIAVASPAVALAAEAPAEAAASDDGGTIVVTATRRATSLQDAPINISAVGSAELARERVDDVKSLSAFTPGLTVADTGPGSTGNIIMRGISSGDTSASGSNYQSALGVYLGEVPMYLDFKLIDISRVEVLQGPQGTLYGLGTLAGAIRYMPNRPNSSKFSVDVHARGFMQSHSNLAGKNVDGTVNIPIIEDHVAFRTTNGYYYNPGFIDYNHLLKTPGVSDPQPGRSATGAGASFGSAADQAANFTSFKDANYERTFTSRNQLLLQANQGLKLYLTYAHQHTSTMGRQANGGGVLGTGRYEAPWRYLEPTTRKSDMFAAEFNIDLGHFAQLVATTAITKQKIMAEADNTDLLLDLDYGYEAFPQFSSHNTTASNYKQFNQEMRLVSTHGGPVSWVVGGFYNNMRYEQQYREYVPGFAGWAGINRPDDLEYMQFVKTRTKEMAVYGEATYRITPVWQVTGGLRYFKYDAFAQGGTDTPLFSSNTPYPLVVFAPSRINTGATSNSGMVWKANTSYKFRDGLLAYATYSTGYRTGNVNRVAPCILPLDPNVQNVCALANEMSFGPDKTRNLEVGLRASLFDKHLNLTLSGFHVDWDAVQVPSTTINGAVGITVNGGKAVSQGFEFAGEWKITPRLSLQTTYSYTDAHLTQDAPGIVVSSGTPYDAKAGDRLPGSTRNSGSAQLNYTYPLADGAAVEANWAATYTGNIYSRVGLRGNGEVIPSYVTHRASVTYRAKTFDVGLYVDNIFNKYAVTAISNDLSSYNRVRTDVVERYYAQGVLTPRRVGVDVHFHY
jgi:iron complex outermembrane receptor protein